MEKSIGLLRESHIVRLKLVVKKPQYELHTIDTTVQFSTVIQLYCARVVSSLI